MRLDIEWEELCLAKPGRNCENLVAVPGGVKSVLLGITDHGLGIMKCRQLSHICLQEDTHSQVRGMQKSERLKI